MPQQINLYKPVLLTQKRYFSARAMAQALALFGVLGGALSVYAVWSLNSATAALRSALGAQAPELAQLRAAIADTRLDSGSNVQALDKELVAVRAQLLERQHTLVELRRGLVAPGQGHAARLQLVAQTIPAQVWVTEVRADESQLELRGYTQDPAVLNDWVSALARSPLLLGQQLAKVKVERTDKPAQWSFTMASMLPAVAIDVQGSRP